MIFRPSHPITEQEAEIIRKYEKGYRDGHLAGWRDANIGLKSSLYWSARDARPNWYEQGYNDGYIVGHAECLAQKVSI